MDIMPVDVRECWDELRPLLQNLRKRFHDTWRPEDVYAACRNGNAFLYKAADEQAFAVFEELQDQYSLEKYMHVWIACSAEGVEHGAIEKYMPAIEALAKQCGYKKISMRSPRVAWRRIPGWREEMTTYVYEVPE